MPLIFSSFNNKFILNKIIPIENELDFGGLIYFFIIYFSNYFIFSNFYNSGDI